jgi:hypothetical protein
MLLCLAAVLPDATEARSGVISPGLLKAIETGSAGQGHAVIIRLKDAIDHQELKAAAESMARGERLRKVVQVIRAEGSQKSLRSYLAPKDVVRSTFEVQHMPVAAEAQSSLHPGCREV